MLIQFSAENHRSIFRRQTLSLVAGKLKESSAPALSTSDALGVDLLPALAIYGANASGKTNIIRALMFMDSAVGRSYRSWNPESPIPRTPFLFGETSERDPSTFEVELLLDGTRYQYGFTLDSERILEEWAFAFPKGRRQLWFERTWTGTSHTYRFGKRLLGQNKTIEGLTRPNSLFLSAAAQNNHDQLSILYNWFANKLTYLTPSTRNRAEITTARECADEGFRTRMAAIMSVADLGITGMEVDEEELSDEVRKAVQALGTALNMTPPESGELPKVPKVKLKHRSWSDSGGFLPFDEESEGTQAYFAMVGVTTKALATGGTLLVDELDSSLHPLLALQFVKAFMSDRTNKRHAQLIFNTHDTNLLDTQVLRRDQVYFAEKDSQGATHIYPLSDFKPRRGENLERGYLQGRYGAIPILEPSGLLAPATSDAD